MGELAEAPSMSGVCEVKWSTWSDWWWVPEQGALDRTSILVNAYFDFVSGSVAYSTFVQGNKPFPLVTVTASRVDVLLENAHTP